MTQRRDGLALADVHWFYLAMPVDLMPDVIPVLAYSDDVAAVALVLRSVVPRAGREAARRHWPGTPEGLAVLSHAVGLPA